MIYMGFMGFILVHMDNGYVYIYGIYMGFLYMGFVWDL